MKSNDKVILGRGTYLKIRAIIDSSISKRSGGKPHYNRFLSELNNLEIVEDGNLPVEIIGLESLIKYRYIGSKELQEAVLSFPADIGDNKTKLSILSPIGLSGDALPAL